MDPIKVVQWCKAEGTRSEASVAIEFPGSNWGKKQIKEVVQTLSPDRKAYVVAVKPDPGTDCTYALIEWGRDVPENFHGASVKLSEKTEFYLTHPSKHEGHSPSQKQLEPLGREAGAAAKSLAERQLADLQRQYRDIQEKFQETSSIIAERINGLRVGLEDQRDSQITPNPGKVLKKRTQGRLQEVTIRKDFHIDGQIGEKGQQGKLSYTSLLHQIELGLQKGYLESEIREAVIHAISPGSSVRGMLERKSGLTLNQLKRILKSYYEEEDATDLFHRLINMTQESRETPQNFLFRAIELKDRLLFASREERSGEHFGAELVKRKFRRSVTTGLRSDYIKLQLKQYLEDPSTPDEVLIEKVNEADKMEIERDQKQRKLQASSTTSAKIQQIGVPSNTQELNVLAACVERGSWLSPVHHLPVSQTGLEKLFQTQKEILEMMTMLMTRLEKPQTEEVPPLKAPETSNIDRPMKQTQRVCFKCGGVGHLRRMCPSPVTETKTKQPGGNFRGPQ